MKIIVEKKKLKKKKKKIVIVKNNIAIRIAGKVSWYIDASINRATPIMHHNNFTCCLFNFYTDDQYCHHEAV